MKRTKHIAEFKSETGKQGIEKRYLVFGASGLSSTTQTLTIKAANDASLMNPNVLIRTLSPCSVISFVGRESFRAISGPASHHFKHFSVKALIAEQQKCVQGDITKQTLGMFISRLRAQLDPYFA